MMRLPALALAALLLGCLLLGLPTPAAAAGVRLEATAGFDGLARAGAWLPVRVTLTNDGPDMQAVVRVQRRGDAAGPSVSQAVELPAGARKSVTLLLLHEAFTGPLTVQVSANGGVLAQTQVEAAVAPGGGSLIGVLAGSPEAAGRVIAGLGGRGANSTARLTAADLPTNPYALTALDALIINGAGTRALSAEQVAALGEWVALGGTLVLGGGGTAAAVLEGLGDLPPVRLTGPAAAVPRLPGLTSLTGTPVEAPGPFVVVPVEPLPAAAVLAGQAGRPLVVTQALGHGRVSFVALDLGLDPFLGWTGGARFWAALLPPPGGGAERLAPLEGGQRLRWALGSGTTIDLPSTGMLGLLLLAYVLVIGPLNYLVLRRLDQREWAWGTVPAVTLLFTGALFFIGAGARGGQVAVNSVSIVRSAAGLPGASVESYAGVFSPGRATLSLRLPGGALVTGLPEVDRGAGGPLPPLQLWQGAAAEVRDVTFAAGEFKTFVAQGRLAAAPLSAELRLEGDRLIGTLRNAGDAPLDELVLLIGREIQPLGTIPPGGEVAVDWAVPLAPAGSGGQPLSVRLNGGRRPDGSGRDWRAQARAQVLDLLYGFEAERAAADGGLVQVLGWQERPALPLTVPGGSVREQAVTLVQHRLPVRLAPGPVSVPPGLLPRTVEGEALRTAGKFGPNLALGPGETVVSFALPGALAGIQADEVDLLMWLGEGASGIGLPAAVAPGGQAGAQPAATPAPRPPGALPTPVPQPAGNAPAPAAKPPAVPPVRGVARPGVVRFSLWDWGSSAWVELPHAGQGRTVVPEARRFVSPAGPIRLKIEVAGASETLFLRQLDLGVRGRLP